MVLAFVLFSELTKAWLLYLGLIFMFMVMYAPGGIASLIMMNVRVARFGRLRGLIPHYVVLALTASVALAGASALIEMIYQVQLEGSDAALRFLGVTLQPAQALHWLLAGAVLLVGGALFEWARRRFARQWGAVQEDIELRVRQMEASA
jgi:branched-chain amino acid transport system permease protein